MEAGEELDWTAATREHDALVKAFEDYEANVERVRSAMNTCQKSLAKQKGANRDFAKLFAKQRKDGKIKEEEYAGYLAQLAERQKFHARVTNALPMNTGMFLNTVLGTVNVTLPHMSDRFKYKSEYEQMKFKGTIAIIVAALVAIYFQSRFIDTLFYFGLGTYYIMVTVREFILIANGSRIKLWWRVHHYVAILQSLVLIEWPDGDTYRQFRESFLFFSLYLGAVQLLQYNYQQAQLYRKRCLGKADPMETTTDLPNRSTFGVLIVALFVAYLFQLSNAWKLFTIGRDQGGEWQVWACAVLFGFLGLGNLVTTMLVLRTRGKEHDD